MDVVERIGLYIILQVLAHGTFADHIVVDGTVNGEFCQFDQCIPILGNADVSGIEEFEMVV